MFGVLNRCIVLPLLLIQLLVLTDIPGSIAGKKGSLRKRAVEGSDEEPPEPAGSRDVDPRPARGGGHRQRRKAADADDDPADEPADADLPLNRNFKRRWGMGELSSATVQSLAFDAQQQGATGLKQLSAAGTYGKHPQNLFRDLLRLFGRPRGAPPIDWVEIPMKNGNSVPHPVIWPHKFFAALARERRDIWSDRIAGSEGALKAFWESMRESEFVRTHPYLPEVGWPKCVPIGMHGDGGAFNKNDNLYTIAWNSLVAKGATVQTRFLFTVVKKSDMVDSTLDVLMEMFGWSCNVLLSGQTPHQDYLNRPLQGGGCDLTPGGFRACLSQARGDWEWIVKIFHFPRWDQLRMCPYCMASPY
jgi:hypothetical protein